MPIFERDSFLQNIAIMPRLMLVLCMSVKFVTVQSEVSFRDVILCILAYTDILEDPAVSIIRAD